MTLGPEEAIIVRLAVRVTVIRVVLEEAGATVIIVHREAGDGSWHHHH